MYNELITQLDPKSPISEVYRSLRTNLQFKNAGNGLKSLLVTSTVQSEGKSMTAANLAITFAQAGKKTIIIDADMRKARQHEIFNVKPTPGLSNYLSGIDENGYDGSENVLSYITDTVIDNLDILPAGNIPPNPSELLISENMTRMMEKLNKTYDIIIFDGTPSLVVTDSIILSRIVDTSIIVVSHKYSKMDNLQKVQKDIENVGGNIAGVVLNKMPISMSKYKDRYYYYGTAAEDTDIEEISQAKKGKKPKEAKKNKKEDKKKENIDGQQSISDNVSRAIVEQNVEKVIEIQEKKENDKAKSKENDKKEKENHLKLSNDDMSEGIEITFNKKEVEVKPVSNCLDITVYKPRSKLKTKLQEKVKIKTKETERLGTKRKTKLNSSKGA